MSPTNVEKLFDEQSHTHTLTRMQFQKYKKFKKPCSLIFRASASQNFPKGGVRKP